MAIFNSYRRDFPHLPRCPESTRRAEPPSSWIGLRSCCGPETDPVRWVTGWVRSPRLVGGLEHGWMIFPNSWDDTPIWRTHIFQRGWNHQPDDVWWFFSSISDRYLWSIDDESLMNHLLIRQDLPEMDRNGTMMDMMGNFFCALFEKHQGESATKKLKTVLLLRCKLPSDYHGDAIPEACLKFARPDVMGKSWCAQMVGVVLRRSELCHHCFSAWYGWAQGLIVPGTPGFAAEWQGCERADRTVGGLRIPSHCRLDRIPRLRRTSKPTKFHIIVCCFLSCLFVFFLPPKGRRCVLLCHALPPCREHSIGPPLGRLAAWIAFFFSQMSRLDRHGARVSLGEGGQRCRWPADGSGSFP